jgi:hypothetical protein
LIMPRRDVAKMRPQSNFGIRAAGGILIAGGAGGAVTASLMAVMLPISAPDRGGTAVYQEPSRYGTLEYQT